MAEQAAAWADRALAHIRDLCAGPVYLHLDTSGPTLGTVPQIITEHAKRMSTGWLVRDTSPVTEWAADQRAEGIRVAHRRIIVVEDWTEDLPPGAVVVSLVHRDSWQDPDISLPPREGWQVSCTAHGMLIGGYAYAAESRARALATRHRHKHRDQAAFEARRT